LEVERDGAAEIEGGGVALADDELRGAAALGARIRGAEAAEEEAGDLVVLSAHAGGLEAAGPRREQEAPGGLRDVREAERGDAAGDARALLGVEALLEDDAGGLAAPVPALEAGEDVDRDRGAGV